MSSYVSNSLTANEKIIKKASIHWFIYASGAAWLLLGVFLLIVAPENAPLPSFLGVIFSLFGVFKLIQAFLYHISTELAVTSKRVVAKFGFIRRNTIELNHRNVESFSVDQSIFGRLFNFGTVHINGTGGVKTPLPAIANPLEFRQIAFEEIEKNK